jgi:phosphoglucosamine mutase
MERMQQTGAVLGGEPSGHIIFGHYATTGDGALAALKLIEAAHFYKKSVSKLVEEIVLLPHDVKSVKATHKKLLDDLVPLQECLKKTQKKLGEKGRVLVRYSGTEPLARVIVEGEDLEVVKALCEEMVEILNRELN